MPKGIEVFGRGATVVSSPPRRRSALPGVLALLAGLATVALLGVALVARDAGQALALPVAVAGSVTGALAVLALVAALVAGRARRLALVGALLGVAADPWLLTRILDLASHFVG